MFSKTQDYGSNAEPAKDKWKQNKSLPQLHFVEKGPGEYSVITKITITTPTDRGQGVLGVYAVIERNNYLSPLQSSFVTTGSKQLKFYETISSECVFFPSHGVG